MRRSVLGVGVLAALIVGAGAAVILTGGGSDRSEVQIETPVIARNIDARASLELAPGWQELATVDTTDPVQVLVVGTATRPAAEPITPCDAANPIPPGSRFVSIYEYVTGARLNSPDRATVYDATQFASRPPDFAAAPPAGSSSCLGPGVTSADHIVDFTFLDSGRFFVARVVSTGDRDGSRLAEAIKVLNTLQIAVPPEVTTTTAPGTTSTTVVPIDAQELALQQITDDLRGAYGGGGPVSGDEAIAGGFPLGEGAKAAARSGHESFIGFIVPRIDWLTLDSPTHATVNFDLLIDGQVITVNTTGEAMLTEGRWKITAETFCTVVRRGGVTCPAR